MICGMSEQKKDWRYWVERKKKWPPPFIPRVRVGPGSIQIVDFDEYFNSPRIQAMLRDMHEMDLTGKRRRRREKEKNGS